MTHQCPKCELRFAWQTELEDHCSKDHPTFHHEYPVRGVHHDYSVTEAEPALRRVADEQADRPDSVVARAADTSAILSTWWTER